MLIRLVTVPYDSGHADERLGAGPGHLAAPVAAALETAGHEVEVLELRLAGAFYSEIEAAIELQALVHRAVSEALASGRLPVVLAGNCNGAAFGCVSALGRPGVVWFDAHGDLNTPETSASGYFDGMSLALLAGHGWPTVRGRMVGLEPVDESAILFIGGRDLDAGERELLAASEISCIGEGEVGAAFDPRVEQLATRAERVYLHIDLDVLDPTALRANPWGRAGGLSADELLGCLETASRSLTLGAIGLTAYGPSYDIEGRGPELAQRIVLAALPESR